MSVQTGETVPRPFGGVKLAAVIVALLAIGGLAVYSFQGPLKKKLSTALVAALKNKDQDEVENSLTNLNDHDEEAPETLSSLTPVLTGALDDKNMELAQSTLTAMLRIGPTQEQLPALTAASLSPDQEVVRLACACLVKLGPIATPILDTAYSTHTDPKCREQVLKSLNSEDTVTWLCAEPILKHATHDDDEGVRKFAADRLAEFGEVMSAYKNSAANLKTEHESGKLVQALKNFHTAYFKENIPQLEKFAEHSDERVREAAKNAVAAIKKDVAQNSDKRIDLAVNSTTFPAPGNKKPGTPVGPNDTKTPSTKVTPTTPVDNKNTVKLMDNYEKGLHAGELPKAPTKLTGNKKNGQFEKIYAPPPDRPLTPRDTVYLEKLKQHTCLNVKMCWGADVECEYVGADTSTDSLHVLYKDNVHSCRMKDVSLIKSGPHIIYLGELK